MIRMAGLFLLALAFAQGACAASFDCSKAAGRVEKAICADSELSRLDQGLGDAYKQALGRSADPAALRAAQAQWLKSQRNRCNTNECLRDAYAARIDALRNVVPRYESLADAIDHACIALAAEAPTASSHCRVTASDRFGSLDSEAFHYAVYCLDETAAESSRCQTGGIGLFALDSGTGRVTRFHLRRDDSGNVFAAPTILRTQGGTVLDMPVGVPGSGNLNASELFLRQGSQWIPVDTASWEAELRRRLPAGLGAWKGIWPDLRSMTAETGLYREKDANCCPSGGTASIRLALQGARLTLVSVRVSP